ncbi:OmpL47-type beta-barrel domain-containing protein [Metabacillus sp. Hm71]|uniref:OmpL47-type beta-barrel domain-containing protein n=1 Tax=Metabacillus sp. Hm71 TaxID=3450743 RepID=UPI003F43303E
MIVWKKRFLAQITVLLLILSLLSPATTSFAQGDIARPTLHSFTVSAKEATVGDKVKISADLTSDFNGIKYVTVHFTKPSGSNGKEIPIKYNSKTRKYEGTFNVEKYDVEGRWRIYSLRVIDNQGNYYYYNDEFKDLNYNINVYGTSFEDTLPTLHSFTVSAKEATVGDKVKISADVTNDVKEIRYVSVYYKNLNDSGTKGISLYYNSTTRKYEGTFNVEKDDRDGKWRVYDISVIYTNSTGDSFPNGYNSYTESEFLRDLNNYDINLYGIPDITPPTLNSLTVSAKEATVGDKVKISADVTNDVTGVKNVRVHYSTLYEFSHGKSINLNYNSTTGKFEGIFNVEKDDIDNEWRLTSIYVYDNQGNEYSFQGDPNYKYDESDTNEYRDLSNYSIKVYGTGFDDTPPTLNSFTVSPKEATVGDKVKISADVTDHESGVSSVYVLYTNPKGNPNTYGIGIPLNYNSKTRKYEGTYSVEKDKGEGEWKIDRIYLYDKKGNYDYREVSKSNYRITIGSPPVTKIELQSSSPKGNEWYSSDVNVSLHATDDQSGVAKTLYKLNNGDWNKYTNAFKLQNEGIHTIEYKSIDKAVNEEEVKSKAVKIDKTAPVSAASDVPTNKTNKDVSITLSASDKHSGAAKTEYRMNDGEWMEYTEPINSFAEGKNRVDYRSIDNAGNVEAYKSFEVNMDKTASVTTPDEDDDQDKDSDNKGSGTDKESEIESEKTENDPNSSDVNKQVDSDKYTHQPVKVMEKNELPATATSVHNLLLLGFMILGFGGAILYIEKKKRAKYRAL